MSGGVCVERRTVVLRGLFTLLEQVGSAREPFAAVIAALPDTPPADSTDVVSRPCTASVTSAISLRRSKLSRISFSPRSSLPSMSCLRTNVFGLRSSNSKSLNSGPSSVRMSSLALSENSRIFRMKREASWMTLGSLSGPKTSTPRITSVTTSSAPMSLNTWLLLVFSETMDQAG